MDALMAQRVQHARDLGVELGKYAEEHDTNGEPRLAELSQRAGRSLVEYADNLEVGEPAAEVGDAPPLP